MSVWGCVGPEIRQIDALRVHLVAVPAIVPDLLTTMSARLNRETDFVKHTRHTAGIVKKSVVGRI